MHFLASLVQEVFERILKRHSHIHMKHFQESNHIFPDTSREQIVGWTFNPEVTDLWEAISKQNWSSKLIPTSTLISGFQVQYFSPFCFRAHTHTKKKHFKKTLERCQVWHGWLLQSYKSRIFPSSRYVCIFLKLPVSSPTHHRWNMRSSKALEICHSCLGSLCASTWKCQFSASQRSGCYINTKSMEINLGIVNWTAEINRIFVPGMFCFISWCFFFKNHGVVFFLSGAWRKRREWMYDE